MISDNKKQQLLENFKREGSLTNYPDWIMQQANKDSHFFRWLFDEELHEDFESSLDEDQKEDYEKFLDELKKDYQKEIKDLYDLADYINLSGEYPSDVEEIVEKKGWELMADELDIAIDHVHKLILTIDCNSGDAVVRDYPFEIN